MKDIIKEAIYNVVSEWVSIDKIIVEIPKKRENGDYSSNICFVLSKVIKKNPLDIALNLKEQIDLKEIDKIEVKDGFLNFYLTKEFLFDNLNFILKQDENYGKNNIGNKMKINLEYVSANPTGILHIGHARGASYGDSMARILKFCGYDVTREYYINDGGNQIINLEKSIKARYDNLCGQELVMPKDGYYGQEIIDIAKEIYDEYGKYANSELFRNKGLEYLLSEIKKDLNNFKVEFDVWTSEQSLYDRKLVDKTLKYLKDNGYTYEKDNALFLKTSLYGDLKDRVLVKSDHTNTYLLPDIAYHIDKYNRGYDKMVDVLGADHHGYVPRLKASISMCGYDASKLDVKILQMVRLIKDGEEVKMSKRTGKSLTMKDLIAMVGVDAVRYFFAARSLDTQMDFDLNLATKKSSENPVYYVSYAHARICSIISDYGKGVNHNLKYTTINSDWAIDLLFKMYQFEDVVKLSAKTKEPHVITNYIYDLATLFHSFYAHEKILTDDDVYTSERINLIKGVKIIIKNALNLIGVKAPNKM